MSKPKNANWNSIKNFPIGTKVLVSAKLVDFVQYHPTTRHEWKTEPCTPFVGWISGARWFCNGDVDVAPTSPGDAPSFRRRLKVSGKVPALLVRKFQFGAEIAVPISAVEEIPLQLTAPGLSLMEAAPVITGHAPGAAARETLSAKAKTTQRGEKGRFLSKP